MRSGPSETTTGLRSARLGHPAPVRRPAGRRRGDGAAAGRQRRRRHRRRRDDQDARRHLPTPTSSTRRPAPAPGVLVWPDIFGLRPAFRTMGKRLAETGYSVLVVNPFYRVKKAPTAEQGAATPIPSLMPARAGAERDDAHDRRQGVHRVARSAAVGGEEPEDRHAGLLHGRSDGVPHGGECPIASARSRRSTAAASSRRMPNSPHTQARRPRRSSSSPSRTTTTSGRPTEKDVLKDTFAQGGPARRDRGLRAPRTAGARPTRGVYNEPLAEKAWSRLLALYGKALA